MAALALLVLFTVPLSADPPAILVSRQLAARARLAVGDVVTLAVDGGGTRGRQFRITGIYEPTPDPMRFTAERMEARVHLPDLIAMTADPDDPAAAESVNAINVKLVDPEDVGAFRDDVRSGDYPTAAESYAATPEKTPCES
jgi:hypothetical protein